MCTFSRVFDHVKPPKNARIVGKKKKKNPKENNRIADFLLGAAHDMQVQKLFGSMRSICVPSFILIRASMCELHIKFSDVFQGAP